MLCWRSSFGASSMSESEERESKKKSESESEPPPNKKSDIESEGSSSDAQRTNSSSSSHYKNRITRDTRSATAENGYGYNTSNHADNNNGTSKTSISTSHASPNASVKKTGASASPTSPPHRSTLNDTKGHLNGHRYTAHTHFTNDTTSTDSEREILSSLSSSTDCIPDPSSSSSSINGITAATFFPWEALPRELLASIWESLDLEDVVKLSMVCRSWKILASNLSDSLWKRFHKR